MSRMTEQSLTTIFIFSKTRVVTLRHVLIVLAMLTGVGSVPAEALTPASGAPPNPRQQINTAAAQTEGKVFGIEPGTSTELRINAGEAHLFPITLAGGQVLSLSVEQRGVDLIVTLVGADDAPLFQVDSTSASRGEEVLFFTAENAGIYKVKVQPAQAGSGGDYTLLVRPIREALPRDKLLSAATRAMAAGDHLRKLRNGEALREAIGNYSQALALWQQDGNEKEATKALYNLGWSYAFLDDCAKSLEFYLPLLPLVRTHGTQEEQAAALLNTAICTLNVGETSEALSYFEQARQLFESLNVPRGLASTLVEIGRSHYLLGDNQEALNYYDRAMDIWRGTKNERGEGFTLDLIGRAQFSLGESTEALRSYEAALPKLEHAGDRRNQASTLTDLGRYYMAQGDYTAAVSFFEKALPLRAVIGDQLGKAETLSYLGEAESHLSQTEKALEHFNEALRLQEAIKDRRGQGDTLHRIGTTYFAAGQSLQALTHLESALRFWQENGYRPGEAETRYQLARVQTSRGRLVEARAQVEAAVSIIESQRASIMGLNPRAFYFASVRSYYEQYIAVLMSLHEKSPQGGFDRLALQVSERARARLLLDAFEEAQYGFQGTDDQNLLARRKLLRQQLSSSADLQIRLLSNKLLPEQAARLTEKLADIEAQLQAVEQQLKARQPRLAGLLSPHILNAADIQRLVPDDTLLLEYALGDEQSWLWVVGKGGVDSFRLPGRADLVSAATPFNDLARKRNWERGDKEKFEAASRALGQILLGRAAPLLGEKRLLIVPDGPLQFVPFAALQLPKPPEREAPTSSEADTHDTFEPLVARHEIIYEPSASTVAAIRQDGGRRASPELAAAIIADPVFSSVATRTASPADDRAQAGVRRGGGEKAMSAAVELKLMAKGAPIPPLLSSGEEAREIYDITRTEGALLAVGFRANRQTATSPQLSRYHVVHFSTHALLNDERPDLSGIVLSLVDERGNPQDGFLQLYEIYNLNLPVELVVLSACQTALGREVKGEGLMSLMRGFMSAGARRVAATQWEVDDEATTELMRQFYLNMFRDKHLPAAAALRSAQLSLQGRKDRWASPFYWAGFVLQGEWGPWTQAARRARGRGFR